MREEIIMLPLVHRKSYWKIQGALPPPAA